MGINNFPSIYAAQLPYPEIRIECPNKSYAKILLVDYAGAVSELGSSCLYMYQYFALYESDQEIARALEGVARVERVHLEMLGKMIWALGLEPKYYAPIRGKMRPWNASYIDYNTKAKEILKSAITQEEAAIKQYREHIQQIRDRNIQEALQRILLDEKHHLQLFTSLYKRDFGIL